MRDDLDVDDSVICEQEGLPQEEAERAEAALQFKLAHILGPSFTRQCVLTTFTLFILFISWQSYQWPYHYFHFYQLYIITHIL